MRKKHISSLLVVFLAGTHVVTAEESLEDVFAQMNAAERPQAVEEVEVQAAEVAVESVSYVEAAPSVDLLSKGIALYEAGQYDEAEAVLEAVLAGDKYNRVAMDYFQRVASKISSVESRKQAASRASAIAAVDAAWNPEMKTMVAVDAGPDSDVPTPEVLATEKTVSELKSVIIPEIDFRDADIKDVIVTLSENSRSQDKNINILLLGQDVADEGATVTISIRDMNLYEVLGYVVEMASMKFEIKPNVVQIMPVDYVQPQDLVMQSFDIIPEIGMEMESMSGGDSGGGVDDLFGDSSSASADIGPMDVASFFSIVEFPIGSTAVYQPTFQKLFVKNTSKNLKAIEDIIADLEDEAIKKRSQQVEIEAKFVEFNEGALEELGFDWTVYGGDDPLMTLGLADGTYTRPTDGYRDNPVDTVGGGSVFNSRVTGVEEVVDPKFARGDTEYRLNGQNVFGAAQRTSRQAFESLQSGILSTMGGLPATMLFSNDEIDLKISAMEQEGTADVLSAPKVTTKSGNEAVIRVVEVHRYPQDWDVETGQRTSPVVKPQDWEDFDLGVKLKVTPVVDAESNTIDLDLSPEITKFKGFDEYKVGSNAYESGGNNASEVFGDSSPLIAKMPYFETRAVQTQVTIADGSTVLMGGLVDERTETFRDQVPFLGDLPYIGRLFRTEGSRTAKKNLVIYVKATQVDDRGMTRKERELARAAAAN